GQLTEDVTDGPDRDDHLAPVRRGGQYPDVAGPDDEHVPRPFPLMAQEIARSVGAAGRVALDHCPFGRPEPEPEALRTPHARKPAGSRYAAQRFRDRVGLLQPHARKRRLPWRCGSSPRLSSDGTRAVVDD